jgi:hypothetical protein
VSRASTGTPALTLRSSRSAFPRTYTRSTGTRARLAGSIALRGLPHAGRNLQALGIRARPPVSGRRGARLLPHLRVRSSLARASHRLLDDPRLAGSSAIPITVSGMRREPPNADPHVRWCGRGQG